MKGATWFVITKGSWPKPYWNARCNCGNALHWRHCEKPPRMEVCRECYVLNALIFKLWWQLCTKGQPDTANYVHTATFPSTSEFPAEVFVLASIAGAPRSYHLKNDCRALMNAKAHVKTATLCKICSRESHESKSTV
jgi:hypothetical protein